MVSSINKTDHHDITEALLKVVVKHHKPNQPNLINSNFIVEKNQENRIGNNFRIHNSKISSLI
jgi:hypothetical protein